MTDPVPSKERIGFLIEYWTAKLGSHRRWPEGQGRQAELMGLIYVDTIAALKQLAKPAHEREPPHCANCSCGLAPEPPPEQKADRAHMYAAHLLESLAEKYGTVPHWQPLPDLLGKLTQIDNLIAGLLSRAAQPPGDG